LPALTDLNSTASFTENTSNTAPQLLDVDVAFTAAGALAGGRLILRGLLGEDRVSILAEGSDAGQIGLSGSTVTYGGVAFGTVSGGVGTDLIVAFNAAATGEAVDALIQRLAYANVSDTPTATRKLVLNVADGAGNSLAPAGFAALTGPADPFAGIDIGQESDPAFGDLDGDGRAELVVGGGGTALRVWRQTESGFVELTGADNPLAGVVTTGYRAISFYPDPALPAFAIGRVGDLALVQYRAPVDGSGGDRLWQQTETRLVSGGSYLSPALADLPGLGRFILAGTFERGLVTLRQDPANLATWVNLTDVTGTAGDPFRSITSAFDSSILRSAPAFMDLDDDGRLDVFVGSQDATFRVWRNTGSGFVELVGAANPLDGLRAGLAGFGPIGGSAPIFFDLDGDGLLDLVSGRRDGTLSTWRNTGEQPAITVAVAAENDAPVITTSAERFVGENTPADTAIHRALATDADGDTIAWSLSGADAALFTIEADGEVRFRAAPDFEAPADADADGRYEIVVEADDGTDVTTQAVTITVTDRPESRLAGLSGTASVAENAANAAPRLLDAEVAFTAGESLAGGRLVVSGLLAEDRVSVLAQGDGAGQIGVEGTTLRFGGVAFGTVSGGVGGDLVVSFGAGVTAAAVDALIQRLAYANASDTPTATRTLAIEVEDAAGRGLAASGPGRLVPLTGSANPFDGVNVGSYVVPTFTDLDGDGRADLVVGTGSGISVWRDTGGGFVQLTGAANPFDGIAGPGAYGQGFTDFDLDGDLDLVVANLQDPVRIYENTLGGYRLVPDSDNPFLEVSGIRWLDGFPAFFSYDGLAFLDLNGDGRDDVIQGSSFRVFLSTPDGYQDTSGQSRPPGGPIPADAPLRNVFGRHPAVADLDGDGLLDLVTTRIPRVDGVADWTNILLAGWRNTGSGFVEMTGADDPFGPLAPLPPRISGQRTVDLPRAAAADLDGDGRTDLIAVNTDGTVFAFRNAPLAATITVTVTAEEESRRLLGGTTGDELYGGSGEDSLLGAGGADTLVGGAGDDSLNGGSGADSMAGGAGDDRYVVDQAGDRIAEAAGGGHDRVFASVDWTLGDHLEWLSLGGSAGLAGTGNGMANRLDGNAGANLLSGLGGHDSLLGGGGADTLDGGAENDTLDGGSGADSMAGGAGDDRYVVDQSGDRIAEASGGGNDRVLASVDWTLGDHLEWLTLTGAADLAGSGNGMANRLDGNAGANLLSGLGGNDRLSGGGGADTLVGGAGRDTLDGGTGADRFAWNAATEGADVVAAFVAADDELVFSAAGFGGGLAVGALAAGGLETVSATATSAAGEGQFIWQEATRILWWDADGQGAGAAVRIASFTGPASVSAADIVIIA
jgi:Ca2+-binding RTX toxin-like protein